ncbi:exendin-3-like [Emydura macquarii macquarii]|uniref:exendin-3-like n=1 Tax=Emydura macquarii macquarii TaxID=1129001 RepID=UPI00352B6CEC
MKSLQWLYLYGLVLVVLIPASWQLVLKDLSDESRWQSFESKSARSFTSDIKRHSEGTFTSDFTRYLDKMKAKDFVHWLINTKRYRYKQNMAETVERGRDSRQAPENGAF